MARTSEAPVRTAAGPLDRERRALFLVSGPASNTHDGLEMQKYLLGTLRRPPVLGPQPLAPEA